LPHRHKNILLALEEVHFPLELILVALV